MWEDADFLWLYITELQSRSKQRIARSTKKPNLGQQEHDNSETEIPWESENTEDGSGIDRG